MRYQMRCVPGVAAALSIAASAAAQSPAGAVRSVTPVFHQLVAFTLPSTFKSAYEKAGASFYIHEHVPEGQTVNDWTQMITLTGTRDLASTPQATPQQFVAALVAGFRRHCPESFTTAELGPQSIGKYPGYAAIASCGRIESGAKGRSEVAVMLAVKGDADYYALQWTERGADAKSSPGIDQRYWAAQLARLNPIRLCPIVPGEAPPYPSCAGH
ncbi:MAG: hypothetical protein ACRETG_13390 [Steroidobacteraceae bacterium]